MEDEKVNDDGAAMSQVSTAGEQADNSNIPSKSHESHKNAKSLFVADDSWSKGLIPCLSNLCLENIVQNFEDNPVLDQLTLLQQDFLLERLSTSLPLYVTSDLIKDGVYWKRCCEHHWEVCDVTDYGNSWKRMFFERRMQDLIEDFVPGETDPRVILDMVPYCNQYIKQLHISQLRVSEEKEYLDHFDFSILLHKLINLEELRVIYNVKVCRMNFEWNMVEMSEQDGECLARAVLYCRALKRLRVQRSSLKDKQCQLMWPHVYHHPYLRELDLCHNMIGDEGAKSLSFLLMRSRLEVLNLCDNQIQDQGAKDLAFALTKKTFLLNLNLRLNRVKDEGGEALGEALKTNRTLQHLNLTANDVTGLTAVAMSNALAENITITSIVLSCNMLGSLSDSVLEDARLQV